MISSVCLGSNNYIDVRFRTYLRDTHLLNMTLIVIGVTLLSLMAQVSIPLPFSPVPITGQSFAVLIIGSLYGAKRAAITTVSYLAIGLLGMPVFSGASFGIAKILGPTGGYLIGFVVAASIMGLLAEMKADRNLKSAFITFAIGHSLIFIFGLIWLGFYVGFSNVLQLGLFPFLPGMVIKTIAASGVNILFWRSKCKREYIH